MAFLKTLTICLLAMLMSLCEGREFDIGNSWKIPSSPDFFDQWAQRNRFQIGDSIVFKYDGKMDSVVEVSEADYKTCNKSNPINSYNDGNTRISIDRSGLFYFISGADGHCDKAQKLEIRVLSPNHHHNSAATPGPSHHHHHHHHHSPAPAPAPLNGGSTLRLGVVGSIGLVMMIVALV